MLGQPRRLHVLVYAFDLEEILMRMRRTLAYLIFASCVLLIVVKNRAAGLGNEVRSGIGLSASPTKRGRCSSH